MSKCIICGEKHSKEYLCCKTVSTGCEGYQSSEKDVGRKKIVKRCDICNERVDWDDPYIHYGGHTCDTHKLDKLGATKRYVGSVIQSYTPMIMGMGDIPKSDLNIPMPPCKPPKEEFELGIYQHFKGNRYSVLAEAFDSETLEEVVIYKALYGDGKWWVRSLKMFNETVIIDGKEVKRFKKI
jgi:hypothetical protein